MLGALAAATRSTGLVLLAPALMLYLYGPRLDRPPDRTAGVPAAGALASRLGGLRPRYRLRADALWLCLIPAAVALFGLALALAGGDGLAPFRSQQIWERHFAGPYVAVWDGLRAAFEGARQLLSFQHAHVYYPAAPGSPTVAASHNLVLLAFLAAAVPAIVLTLRRLPRAYGALRHRCARAAAVLPGDRPAADVAAALLARAVPAPLAAGAWIAEHPRARRPLLGASAALMVVFLAQFATWHWVA